MGFITLEQGSPEWLKWRGGGVDVSEVFPLACWAPEIGFKEPNPRPITKLPSWLQTPAQLYRRKKGLEPPVVVNANMARGNRLGSVIRVGFGEAFKAEMVPVCVEAGSPWQVSLDGYAKPNGSAIILEIKAPARRWLELPEYVACQVAYESAAVRAVLGKNVKIRAGVTAGYETDEGEHKADGLSFDIFPVAEDVEFERWLLKLTKFFWKTYIEKNKEPPLVKGDVTVREDLPFLDAAADYEVAFKKLEQASSDLDSARTALLAEVGEFVGAVAGGNVRLTSVPRKGSVDYKKVMAALLPDADVEPYRKAGTTTVMVKVTGDTVTDD